MLWRNSRGRPLNAPAAFIHPCQPIVAKQPPSGPGWAHELKSKLPPRSTATRLLMLKLFGSIQTALRSSMQLPPSGHSPGYAVVRREPFSERKAVLRKVLRRTRRGIQYVEHTEGDGGEMFEAVCKLGLEGIVSKKVDAPYRSGPSKTWIKVKNPKSPAATRAIDGTF